MSNQAQARRAYLRHLQDVLHARIRPDGEYVFDAGRGLPDLYASVLRCLQDFGRPVSIRLLQATCNLSGQTVRSALACDRVVEHDGRYSLTDRYGPGRMQT